MLNVPIYRQNYCDDVEQVYLVATASSADGRAIVWKGTGVPQDSLHGMWRSSFAFKLYILLSAAVVLCASVVIWLLSSTN